jgi:transaldolase
MSADGGDCETVLDEFATAGIDVYDLAARLQDEVAKSSSILGTSSWV